MPPTSRLGLLYVGVAVFFFSTSAIFIRWAGALASYEITFWRLAIAAAALGLAAILRRQCWDIPRRQWGRFIAFGLVAALHFLFYAAAVRFTTIAHALAIVYTAPIFVAILSALFLHETLSRRRWLGIVVAVVGVAILAGFQPQATPSMLLGDLLALGSALTYGLYSVIGRAQRHQSSLLTYAFTVYGVAALWSLAPAALSFTPHGYTTASVLSLLALGLLPLALGHTLYNAALRHTNATYANIIAMLEVAGAILLGVLFLGEIPAANEMAGTLVTLIGVLLVLF
jgi:drug/metabolite transporter (DMT)-like permease